MIDDTEAQNQKQEYWEKSMRDSLTGLFNRDAAGTVCQPVYAGRGAERRKEL
ncbi:MAG: hypothetical protein ACLRZZ_12470 [Enterocloster sp.]